MRSRVEGHGRVGGTARGLASGAYPSTTLRVVPRAGEDKA